MKLKKLLLAAIAVVATALPSHAQYYEIANQLTNLISPALSGSMNYRGFVEAKGVAGIGQNRANFIGLSTTQGFQYASWFFMGAGLGIDMIRTSDGIEPISDYYGYGSEYDRQYYVATSKTRAMIPVFSDFRFNIGSGLKSASMFIDLKLGAAWLLGSKNLPLQDAVLTTGTQFYMVPSIGVRIPINQTNAKQAVNIGLAYELLTSNNRFYTYNSPTLNSIGMTIGFEW